MDKPLAVLLLLLLASPAEPSPKMESSVMKQFFRGLFGHTDDDHTVEPSTTHIHTTTEPTTTTTPTPTPTSTPTPTTTPTTTPVTTTIPTTTITPLEPPKTILLEGKTTSSESNGDSDNTELIFTILAIHLICLTVAATIWLCFAIHKYVQKLLAARTLAARRKVEELSLSHVDPDGYETFDGRGPHRNRFF